LSPTSASSTVDARVASAAGGATSIETLDLSPPRLSVVVPMRNEAANVTALHGELTAALRGIAYEVVVVDDSNDSVSRPALEDVARTDPRWRVIARPPEGQTGLGTAVVEGIQAARGEAVCVMDGDLQHPPALVPRLLEALEDGADLAVASRYMPGGSRAGLDGKVRQIVSRGATWVARRLFPEARKTTDPLTGFFCCRRQALLGLEYRPLGFKVLLEVLVCSEGLRVVDIPLSFQSRFAGESKATAKQGMLYLRHIWSLFVYVPGSARTWKFLLVSAASLAVFFPLLFLLRRTGLPWILAWLLAATAGAALTVRLHRIFTFRDYLGRAEAGDGGLYYPIAGLVAQVLFAVVALALTGRDHPWLLLAAVSQAVAMVVIGVLNRQDIRRLIHASLAKRAPSSLEALGKRLGAQWSCWIEIGQPRPALVPSHLASLLADDVVDRVAARGRPTLWTEPPSARPQARVNIETPSALLIPFLNTQGWTVAVAVLARYAPDPFEARQLRQAIVWLQRIGLNELQLKPAPDPIVEPALLGELQLAGRA
jgi:dolichol-phosphate mannosyltransferase